MKIKSNHSQQDQPETHPDKKNWSAAKTYFLLAKSEPVNPDSDLTAMLTQGRDRILTIMLRLASLFGILGVFSINNLLAKQRWELVVVYLSGMIAIGIISYFPRTNYVVRVLTFLSIIFLIGIIDLSFFGIAEDWRLYFSAFTILATVFLGWRAGSVALFLSLTAFITIARQIALKKIVITASAMVSPIPTLDDIIAFSLVFVMINAIVIAAITTLLSEFEQATKKEHQAAIKLGQRTAALEDSLKRERQLAREVVFALEQAEELSKLRATIITTISHEFRTPLTVINNSASLLDKYYDRLSENKRQDQYDRIYHSINYLTELLRDVSLVENTRTNATQPQQEKMQFSELCQRLTVDLWQETAVPPNLHTQFTGPESGGLVVDYYLLKQVIFNLLTNALKYSPPQAPILLHLAYDTGLTITITDQGIGIPEADKAQVWDLFYRGSNIESRSGLGLGLYVVKQLLETMTGTISLQDNPVGGTICTVQLPVDPNDAKAISPNLYIDALSTVC